MLDRKIVQIMWVVCALILYIGFLVPVTLFNVCSHGVVGEASEIVTQSNIYIGFDLSLTIFL